MIRSYVSGDAASTLCIFLMAIDITAEPYYTPDQRRAWAGKHELMGWNTDRQLAHTLIAEEQGEVIGFSDSNEEGYIDMMYVHPSHARCGVASALLQEDLSWSAAHGAMEATTYASRAARPFFERHGFCTVSTNTVNLGGVSLVNFLMRRSICGMNLPERPAYSDGPHARRAMG